MAKKVGVAEKWAGARGGWGCLEGVWLQLSYPFSVVGHSSVTS